jgi:hypothetical protein
MSNEVTSTTTAASVSLSTGKEVAPAGFRLITLGWKETKEKDATGKEIKVPARKSVAICLPVLSAIAVEPECIQRAVSAMLADLQEKCVRSLVEDGAVTIPHDAVDYPALAAFYEVTATSKKMSGASIGAWFEANIQDSLMKVLTSALNLTAESNDLDMTNLIKAVSIYREGFVELAAPRPVLPLANVRNLLKAISLCKSPDDDMAKSLSAKLTLLATPKATAEMVDINI